MLRTRRGRLGDTGANVAASQLVVSALPAKTKGDVSSPGQNSHAAHVRVRRCFLLSAGWKI